MKKVFNNSIFMFIFGVLVTVCFAIGVYAINANEIDYKNGKKVSEALDDLYTKTSNNSGGFCKKVDGNSNTVGSKYECDPGDGIYRLFYVLKVNDNTVDLIMDRNINKGTLNYESALDYFSTGEGSTIATSWSNVVSVTIPKVQDIASAVGNDNWNATDWFYLDKYNDNYQNTNQVANNVNRSAYGWLYEHTRECDLYGCTLNTSLDSSAAYGYWLQEKTSPSSNNAWSVYRCGHIYSFGITLNTYLGIRPVITVSKSDIL